MAAWQRASRWCRLRRALEFGSVWLYTCGLDVAVALHVGGPVGNAVVCPSTICYVQPWNELHVTMSTKRGNNN
ncbi:hypothetical protein OUZ56_029129 [Daphnia magna]|uniref:Secreted protein n=1 Tax=Daphnia magna TaxID=35525 RepID=A0ABR0B5X3_9CRUS|nr:hypothetical protein OUZ56_029129 [Daphnia magna]